MIQYGNNTCTNKGFCIHSQLRNGICNTNNDTQICQFTIKITQDTLYNCTKIGTVRRQTYRTGWAVLLLLQQMSHPLSIRSEWVQKKIAKTIQSSWYKQDNIQRPIQLISVRNSLIYYSKYMENGMCTLQLYCFLLSSCKPSNTEWKNTCKLRACINSIKPNQTYAVSVNSSTFLLCAVNIYRLIDHNKVWAFGNYWASPVKR